MKRSIIIIVLSLIPQLTTMPIQSGTKPTVNDFRRKFPSWDNYNEKTRLQIVNMYYRSSNKYDWFPEYHYRKPQRSYTIKN